ncbi:5-methyltetrahydropteroyltriglutamate--homocysteine methyltransferase [Nitrospira sp. KM1]|uniref:5-methyltetrahydropteroyltriglutamate-- homocysteine S-methyltransferase n=1 Tax=Nitrospira sp. KM1 TaxID=1936990 RepID=UPI0013A7B1A2|nr:5-methyltetrahydropteroyltriglutamate--homocysteine S-methyltransferase [Nitrospira sp. KM1]BCA53361.1 5-methyltetrahydropteroyltriglutamate--homocysteine methyltransferase [Nitrospira sp. KM1]
MSILATCLGYPRIGAARELKYALESYWSGKRTAADLLQAGYDLRRRHWSAMKSAGIDHIPVGDFSLYDHMLDAAVMVGAVPQRYQAIADPLTRYFAMARGYQDSKGLDLSALEMTKWFDTNYHFIVPELERTQKFSLNAAKLYAEIEEARRLGIESRPVIIGPVTFLLLSKLQDGKTQDAIPLDLLGDLLPVYKRILHELAEREITWLQIDEPCLVLDLDDRAKAAYRLAYAQLAECPSRPRLLLATYFGALEDNLSVAIQSGCDALHIDLVRHPEQLSALLEVLPSSMCLSLGVVDGRNIWRTNLDVARAMVNRAVLSLGAHRVWVAPSCSLIHVPVDVQSEQKIDADLMSWLAFAEQKLTEVCQLADGGRFDDPIAPHVLASRAMRAAKAQSSRIHDSEVQKRIQGVTEADLHRASPFADRHRVQHARFKLPLFPTTTIGSFPQTGDVRSARAAWRSGRMTAEEYKAFLKKETRVCIEKQEAINLDVLVHGEFERTDMVEYFGEHLKGVAFTEQGWVQSYGSRCVKPPVIFGDVSRSSSMTVEWSTYAQSLTRRPMKGMLTGPVTILQWSFVRDDVPRKDVCRQIALALRDEVADLEQAGLAMIQVDEPAVREGLPLRRAEWRSYLRWAVDAFRLATSGVRDDTQIHTHMCYSEFGDILEAIAEMDADVISIETSRSRMELLGDFIRYQYPNAIGPGVYDIHSPRVPTKEEMANLLVHAGKILPPTRLWVNPDCGLKTRGWPEVQTALINMVGAARVARRQFGEERFG